MRNAVTRFCASRLTACTFGPFEVRDNATVGVVVIAQREVNMAKVKTKRDVLEVSRQFWVHGTPVEPCTDDEAGDVEDTMARRLGELEL